MASKWTTVAPGIRCRDHPNRKHGVRPDRYFTLRFSVDGRQVEEALGWASDGWTLQRGQEELGKLREAKRTGSGLTTLRRKAAAQRRAEQERQEAAAARERQEKTVVDLWGRYVAEVVAVANKPRTAAEKARMWERRIKPAIGTMKVRDVTEEDAGAVVRAPLRLDAAGRVTGGKAEAGNIYRLLHHMFKKALGWGLRPKELGNPLDNIDEPKVPRRERLLTGGEIGALLRTLDRAKAEGIEAPQMVAVMRAAILTGSRISELLSLRWSDIRRDEMELHFPDTKTGFSRRPMSSETLAVFDSVERMPGVPFVFRSPREPSAPIPYPAAQRAFQRIVKAAGVANCSLHTVRHWYVTAIANTVSNPRTGMALSGHKSHAAYLGYVHTDRAQVHALAAQLAAFTTGLAKAESPVTPLPKRECS